VPRQAKAVRLVQGKATPWIDANRFNTAAIAAGKPGKQPGKTMRVTAAVHS